MDSNESVNVFSTNGSNNKKRKLKNDCLYFLCFLRDAFCFPVSCTVLIKHIQNISILNERKVSYQAVVGFSNKLKTELKTIFQNSKFKLRIRSVIRLPNSLARQDNTILLCWCADNRKIIAKSKPLLYSFVNCCP